MSRSIYLLVFALLPVMATAQSTEELDPLLVSATRSQERGIRTPANITVISRAEMDATGAANLADLLRGHSGIQISDLFGDGSRPIVSLRGFGGNAQANTLILVDGRRLNNADLGAPDLNTIPLADIERIEIVEGSSGVLFGDQAVAGVINIITRTANKLRINATLQAGSYDHFAESVSLENRHANGIGYRFSAHNRESDNYRRDNQLDLTDFSGKLDYRSRRGSAFMEYQSIYENLETPGALFLDQIALDRQQPLNPADFVETHTGAARAGFTADLPHGWQVQAELTNRYSGADGVLSFGGFPGSFETKRQHQEFTPRLHRRWHNEQGEALLTVGADVFLTHFQLSSILGTIDDEQDQYAGYARLIYPLADSLDVTVGTRHARVQNDIEGALLPPDTEIDDSGNANEFGLSYQASPALRLFGRVETLYRFVLADEYTSASFGFPPEIPQTQNGRSAEAGMEWNSPQLSASLVGYNLELENEIEFDPLKFINTNIGDTRRLGLITQLRYTPDIFTGSPLTFTARYGFVEPSITSGALQGKDIPFVAAHTGSLGAEYRLPHGFSVAADAYGISSRTAVGDFNNTLPGVQGYVIANANLLWRWRGLEMGLRANNLLDKEYADNAQTGFRPPFFTPETVRFPAPERNFIFTIGYTYQ